MWHFPIFSIFLSAISPRGSDLPTWGASGSLACCCELRCGAAERLKPRGSLLRTLGCLCHRGGAASLEMWHLQRRRGWKYVEAAAAVARSEPTWRRFSQAPAEMGSGVNGMCEGRVLGRFCAGIGAKIWGYLFISARLEEHQRARSGRRPSTRACFGESPKCWWKDDSHQELGFSSEPTNQVR